MKKAILECLGYTLLLVVCFLIFTGCSEPYEGTVVDKADIPSELLYAFDQTYYCPTPREANKMVADWRGVIKREYSKQYDCDDFSQEMVVYIKRKYNKRSMGAESVALFNWWSGDHLTVAFLTTEGLSWYEPETGVRLREDYYNNFRLGF